ncbi:MAG: zinc ribbon domain-containing protein [Syntrophomonadaceae bacterium]|nr:zinc ribbon domain-containing protein [Syntrophomonadaceae bacterium]
MAYYDFKCESCGHSFEVKTSPHDLDKVQCPQCEGKSLKRIYGHFGMFVRMGKYSGTSGPRQGPGSEPPVPPACLDCSRSG